METENYRDGLRFKPVINHKINRIDEHLILCLEEWGHWEGFHNDIGHFQRTWRRVKDIHIFLRLKGKTTLFKYGVYLNMYCCDHIIKLIVRDILLFFSL